MGHAVVQAQTIGRLVLTLWYSRKTGADHLSDIGRGEERDEDHDRKDRVDACARWQEVLKQNHRNKDQRDQRNAPDHLDEACRQLVDDHHV